MIIIINWKGALASLEVNHSAGRHQGLEMSSSSRPSRYWIWPCPHHSLGSAHTSGRFNKFSPGEWANSNVHHYNRFLLVIFMSIADYWQILVNIIIITIIWSWPSYYDDAHISISVLMPHDTNQREFAEKLWGWLQIGFHHHHHFDQHHHLLDVDHHRLRQQGPGDPCLAATIITIMTTSTITTFMMTILIVTRDRVTLASQRVADHHLADRLRDTTSWRSELSSELDRNRWEVWCAGNIAPWLSLSESDWLSSPFCRNQTNMLLNTMSLLEHHQHQHHPHHHQRHQHKLFVGTRRTCCWRPDPNLSMQWRRRNIHSESIQKIFTQGGYFRSTEYHNMTTTGKGEWELIEFLTQLRQIFIRRLLFFYPSSPSSSSS